MLISYPVLSSPTLFSLLSRAASNVDQQVVALCALGAAKSLWSFFWLRQADLDKNNALTFDEWVRLLALNYSALLQPKAGKGMGA